MGSGSAARGYPRSFLALAIALVLTRLVARPIAQLGRAIRRLGRTDFARPVAAPVALETLLQGSLQAHRLAATAKGQRLALETRHIGLWADAAKLRSIIDNLVGNAVKFTPAGGSITVLARERRAVVEFDVIDSGPGILAAEREAIAREFVSAQGGRIEVVAAAQGGHFRVIFPKRPAPALAEAG